MTDQPTTDTPQVTATRYRVQLGTWAADVTDDGDGWRVDSPVVGAVSQVIGWFTLPLPDPAAFRWATAEDAQAAAETILQAAGAYLGAVLGTAPAAPPAPDPGV
jgi:hypothetical protein